jgi:hypothetical protein
MPADTSFFANMRRNANTLRQGYGAAGKILGSTAAGRAFQQGFAENLGVMFEHETVKGLGKVTMSYGFGGWRALTSTPKVFGPVAGVHPNMVRAAEKVFGQKLAKGKLLGKLGKMGGASLGVAGLAWGIYSGYKEGGVSGAIRETATQGLIWGGLRVASIALSGWGTPLAIAIGIGYTGYQIGEVAGRYANRLRNIEMGAPIIDPFGTAATIRQRSLNALQNTHINGRSALGNESLLMGRGLFGR